MKSNEDLLNRFKYDSNHRKPSQATHNHSQKYGFGYVIGINNER